MISIDVVLLVYSYSMVYLKSRFHGDKYSLLLQLIIPFHRCQIIYTVMSHKLEIRNNSSNLFGQMRNVEFLTFHALKIILRQPFTESIAQCEQGIWCLNLQKSGFPKLLINNRANRICKSAKIRVGSSYRKLSRRFNVFHETVRRVLQKGCLKCRKRLKCSQELQFVVIVLAEIMFPTLSLLDNSPYDVPTRFFVVSQILLAWFMAGKSGLSLFGKSGHCIRTLFAFCNYFCKRLP